MDERPENLSSDQYDEEDRPRLLRYLIKLLLGLAGGTLILVGILLLVLPGPGWALIFSGLGLLAMEFVWARRILTQTRDRFEDEFEKWFKNQEEE